MAAKDVKLYYEVESLRSRLSLLEKSLFEVGNMVNDCLEGFRQLQGSSEDMPDRVSRADLVMQAIERLSIKVDNLEIARGAKPDEDADGSSVSSRGDGVSVPGVATQSDQPDDKGQRDEAVPADEVRRDGQGVPDIQGDNGGAGEVKIADDVEKHPTPRSERARKLSELVTMPHPVWPTMSDTDRTIYLTVDKLPYSRIIPFKSARYFKGMLRTRFSGGFKYVYCKSFYDANTGYTVFNVEKEDDTYSEGAYTELILTNGDRRVAYPLSKSREQVGWTGVTVDLLKQVVATAVGINDPDQAAE